MIFGNGIDMIEIKRILRVWERFGDSFLERVYTEHEREYCLGKSSPGPHLAARFAAKEAAAKALRTGFVGMKMRDFGVMEDEGGCPYLTVQGGAFKKMQQQQISCFFLSLSHCREYAIAQVLAVTQKGSV